MPDLPTPSKTVTIVCRIVAVVLILPALVPLSIGIWAFNHSMDFLSTALPAEAAIVRNVEKPSESGLELTMYTPVVGFTTQAGEYHEFEATYSTDNPAYSAEETVAIVYQPDDPSRWRFDAWATHWGLATTTLGIFGVVLVTSLGLWILAPRLIAWMQMNAKR